MHFRFSFQFSLRPIFPPILMRGRANTMSRDYCWSKLVLLRWNWTELQQNPFFPFLKPKIKCITTKIEEEIEGARISKRVQSCREISIGCRKKKITQQTFIAAKRFFFQMSLFSAGNKEGKKWGGFEVRKKQVRKEEEKKNPLFTDEGKLKRYKVVLAASFALAFLSDPGISNCQNFGSSLFLFRGEENVLLRLF